MYLFGTSKYKSLHNLIYLCLPAVEPLVQNYTDGENFTIEEEKSITFQCIADGIPVPNIIWTRNGELVSFNPRFTVAAVIMRAPYRPNITQALQSSLTVTRALSADTGDYFCTADNSAGRDFLPVPFVLNVTASEFLIQNKLNVSLEYTPLGVIEYYH